jgi:hypothetical protein
MNKMFLSTLAFQNLSALYGILNFPPKFNYVSVYVSTRNVEEKCLGVLIHK